MMTIQIRMLMALVALSLPIIGSAQSSEEPPQRPEKFDVPFYAPQAYIDHAQFFEEEVIQVGANKIWSFNTPNGGFGNVIIIEGEDELVILDTTTGIEHAAVAAKQLREMTQKPIAAVIYTHHHLDHINGTTEFISREDAASGKVKVIAAENFVREAALENGATGPIMGLRAGYMYGVLLPEDAEGTHYHIGCCGFDVTGTAGYIAPNTFIPMEGETEMVLAGKRFVFFHTGGEAASHIAIYMPDEKIVFTGDELQGPTFPQLHSLRGTQPRDIERWIGAVDKMRAYDSDFLVPSHGQIVEGDAEVQRVLAYYRDSMQYVHDQSVRLINAGFTPDEIAETVRLPESVIIEPWTTEYYGNVDVSARNVYGGYISWWNGDPAELKPTPRQEKARRTIEMMGGRDQVFAAAETAFFDGDPQWAAELVTPLIRVNKDDWQARFLKAAALRKIGYQQTSSSLRGFYLTGALEIEGKVDPGALQAMLAKQVFSVVDAPTEMIFDMLRFRVNPERARGKELTIGYDFTDTDEQYTLNLRNSILEIHQSLPDEADAVLTLTREFGNEILLGEESFESGLEQGAIRIKGDVASVGVFHSAFDQPGDLPPPNLALR